MSNESKIFLKKSKLPKKTERRLLDEGELAKIDSAKMDSLIEHPHGVTEELYKDGSKRFTGPGGGVLMFLPDGRVELDWKPRFNDQRVHLLMKVADLMPQVPLEMDDVGNYKDEARMMLEALRMGNAAFFREIGDALLPRGAAEDIKASNAAGKALTESEVLLSIRKAAEQSKGELPSFSVLRQHYNKLAYNRDDTPSKIRRRYQRFGFEWLVPTKS